VYADWSSTLTLTREASKPVVTIGVGNEASSLDAPPVPPEWYNSIILNRYDIEDWGASLSIDIRKSGQTTYCWGLSINPHGIMGGPMATTSVLSWDFSDLSGTFELKEGFECNGNTLVQDMKTVNTYDVTGTNSDKYYNIVHTISNDPPDQFNIVASKTGNGTIDPAGTITVNSGDNKEFTFTPDSGYIVDNIIVDGVTKPAASSYSFHNVSANHSIHVNFKQPDAFTIAATSDLNGTISPSGNISVNSGNDKTFTFTPNQGYEIKSVLIDGNSVESTSSYTFDNVTANHSIHVSFQLTTQSTYTIVASAAQNGSINPAGNVSVNQGNDKTFTITPNSGYKIANLLVDGASVNPADSFTFYNVDSDHVIAVTFEEVTESEEWQTEIKLSRESSSPFVVIGEKAVPSRIESPPAPPEYDALIRIFEYENSKATYYIEDIRQTGQTEYCWGFAVDPHGTPGPPYDLSAEMTWNFSGVPGAFRMEEGYTCGGDSGPIIVNDMKTETSLTITGRSEMYVSIIHTLGSKPVITMNGYAEISVEKCTQYTETGATAFDETDGDISDDIQITGNVDTSVVTDDNTPYVVTYNVKNSLGIPADTKTRKVFVEDTTPPEIKPIGDKVIELTVGSEYIEQGAEAIDPNCETNLTDEIETSGSVDVNTPGTYTITYYVEDDSGNAATAYRRISIEDFRKISSRVTYSGYLSGTLHVWAYTTTALDDRVGEVTQSIDANSTEDVTLNLPEGTYFLKAFIDTNDNDTIDPGEPVGGHNEPPIIIGKSDYPETIYIELTSDEEPNFQLVSANPEHPKAIVGRQLSFDLEYTTTDNNNMLSGIGLKIHYDSDFLSIDTSGITNILTGLAGDPLIKDENVDHGDLNTDKVIVLFWSDPLNAKWPGVTLPAKLCSFTFDVNEGRSKGEKTSIIITDTTTAAGYAFYASPADLTISTFCLDIDGNVPVDALTDGLLILRFLAGLNQGDSLIKNAVADGCTRCTWEEIAAYLEINKEFLDVDGDGKADALTDGLLILRYMAGLNAGTSLTEGAVADGCTRCTWKEIAAYIKSLMCD
jgi:uncharacterized protein (DUF2141 family)